MDCDGDIDFNDINYFVQALSGEAAWPYPDCPWLNGDCDGDETVTFDDISPFVALIGTTCRSRTSEPVWLGPDTTCDMCPCVVLCPDGATPEPEPCGEDMNGGCNMPAGSESFTPVSPGESLCGTCWADAGARDMDWFVVEVPDSGDPCTGLQLTVEVEAEFPLHCGRLEQIVPGLPGCGNLTGQFVDERVAEACTPTSFTTTSLPGGTYYLWLSAFAYDGHPCGSEVDYVITVTGTWHTEPSCPVPPPSQPYTPEGEPDCGDDYIDTFNGGCLSNPPTFSDIGCGDVAEALIYGRTGTYLASGFPAKDRDWYRFVGNGGSTRFTFTLEHAACAPLELLILATMDGCPSYWIVDSYVVEGCQPLCSVTTNCLSAAAEYWFYVSPLNDTGIPCGTAYVLQIEACEDCSCTVDCPPGKADENEPRVGHRL